MTGPATVVGYTAGADTWCPECGLAQGGDADFGNETPQPIFADSEWDTPQHCANCGVLLDCDLTADGEAYVGRALIDFALSDGTSGDRATIKTWWDRWSGGGLENDDSYDIAVHFINRLLETS